MKCKLLSIGQLGDIIIGPHMRCPSCLALLQESAEVCPGCQFSLAALDKKFGTVPKNYYRLTDFASFFHEKEQGLLQKRLVEMERHFPGLYVSIMTMEVHRLFKPREYLFWLMNRCHFIPMECRLERCFSIVLFFDSNSKTALITTGLGLQNMLSEETLEKILELGLPDFRKEHFYDGTTKVLDEVGRQLKSYCKTGGSQPIPNLDEKVVADGQLKPVEDLF